MKRYTGAQRRQSWSDISPVAWLTAELVAEPSTPGEVLFHDDDLTNTDSCTLRREQARLRFGLVLLDSPAEWATRRLERITSELEARRGR